MLDVALASGWLAILAIIGSDISLLNDSIDIWLRLLQALAVLAIIGGVIGLINLVQVLRDRSRSGWAKLGSATLAFVTLSAAWLVVALRLVTPSLQF